MRGILINQDQLMTMVTQNKNRIKILNQRLEKIKSNILSLNKKTNRLIVLINNHKDSSKINQKIKLWIKTTIHNLKKLNMKILPKNN